MTNKRDLKKYIARVGSEIAEVILPAAVYTKAITEDTAEDILNKLSQLQAEALAKINIAFDKAPAAFDSLRSYHAAKAKYFSTAYGKIVKDYEDGVAELISTVNKAKK